MSSSVDLILPSTAPTQEYRKASHIGALFTVYTLVDLGPDDVATELLRAVEGDDPNCRSTCKLAPMYDFRGQPLKAVYDYHLELAHLGQYHPTLFVVAVDQDYMKTGVLLVNLDVDLDCHVDTCRIKVKEAALALINISIANMDWEDFKEDELSQENPANTGKATGNSAEAENALQSPPSKPKHVFDIYTTADANMTTIPKQLDPCWDKRHPTYSPCRSVCSYIDFADPWQQMINSHPWNCKRDPELHRQLYICADKKDVEAEGVILVQEAWDGNIDRDPAELVRIGSDLTVRSHRCILSETIELLTSIARGERDFEMLWES